MTAVLSIEDLTVTYHTARGPVPALDAVTFVVGDHESVALVGESGSGKSTIAAATLGVLPRSATISGRVVVGDVDLLAATERTAEQARRTAVAYVPQDTGAALNPVVAVVDQVAEVYRVHQGLDRKPARAEAAARLAELDVDPRVAAERLLPDELSGGMRQRSLLAIAMALDPVLIVADEPTSALDPETAIGVLDAIAALRARSGASLLMVTHDLGVAQLVADRVVVLDRGTVVEDGAAAEVLTRPRHTYTRALVESTPRLDAGHD